MAAIPKKVVERYVKTVSKFQRVLKIAQDRDVNEADTVSIAQDILAEVFGFDKYLEITSEYAIRGTYCDLAIKIDEKIQYLLEVKAIGLTLKASHLRQVVDYGANHGVQWVVLTNGIMWELYRIRFERPIDCDLVSSFNFLELNPRKEDDQQKLFLLSKKGLSKSIREDYYERVQSVNRFVIGAIVLSESVVNAIRRDIRKLVAGLKVDDKEIEQILINEVLKRDVIEGEEASKAASRVRRLMKKAAKKTAQKKPEQATAPKVSATSSSAQLPDDAERVST
ncbi:MAG: type I restriction enzyme HsdR N-terminal domain-containing protein [Deltaproteobacteria bacterium]|nr:type I restriction enzyme HsdR N-terminal domain-containing protein [Deltaproteobacteria bacterium]